ncbi:MAG: hypothetical protein V1773_03425 [bacterium]
MTTLPPSKINKFNENTIERKSYDLAESFSKYLPIANHRNRLGFNIYKNLTGQGDSAEMIIKTGKYKLEGIEKTELINLLEAELAKLA